MIAKIMAGVCVAVAAIAALLAAPTPAAARDCEAWKGDSEIRCLSKGPAAVSGETVTLKNLSAAGVSFYVREWYSQCGYDSDEEPSLEKSYGLAAGDSGRLALTPTMAKGNDPCTEFFVYGCSSAGGKGVDCHTHLQADISADASAPPLRRACEPRKGGNQIYCLSAGGVPETLVVASRSSQDISFSVQEWYSACQLTASGQSSVSVQQVGSKQSAALPVGFTWPGQNLPNPQSRCTEIFISKCRDASSKPTNCGDNLLATVGQ